GRRSISRRPVGFPGGGGQFRRHPAVVGDDRSTGARHVRLDPNQFREVDMKWTAVTTLAFGSLIAPNAFRPDTTKGINPVPVALTPPEGHVMLFKARAEGVQIYLCKADVDDPGRLEWVLKAPDADLFDERGGRIGRHFAGPTWEAFEDGS